MPDYHPLQCNVLPKSSIYWQVRLATGLEEENVPSIDAQKGDGACKIHGPTTELVDDECQRTTIDEIPACVCKVNLVDGFIVGDSDVFEDALKIGTTSVSASWFLFEMNTNLIIPFPDHWVKRPRKQAMMTRLRIPGVATSSFQLLFLFSNSICRVALI